jgi:hypothetical protein
MATEAENLATARAAILAELASITTDSPDYNVDGQSVSRRRKGLLEDLKAINEQIAAIDGPYEIVSEAY